MLDYDGGIEHLRDLFLMSGCSIDGAPRQVLMNTAYCSFAHHDEELIERSGVAVLGTTFALGGWIRKRYCSYCTGSGHYRAEEIDETCLECAGSRASCSDNFSEFIFPLAANKARKLFLNPGNGLLKTSIS